MQSIKSVGRLHGLFPSLAPLLCIRLTCIDELTRYVVFFNESNYAVEGIDRRSAKTLVEEHRGKDAKREEKGGFVRFFTLGSTPGVFIPTKLSIKGAGRGK